MNRFRQWLVVVVVASLSLLQAPATLAAPRAQLWERWVSHDDSSARGIDHQVWHDLLARYVRPAADGVNRLDYAGFSQADRALLQAYIERLSATAIRTYARAEQRAFWINLYNALTVKIILDHYPVASIRDIDISPGFFSDGPWGKKLLQIDGEAVSLDDMEHRILRPIWRDPRIHYAVNCASIGCPNLQAEAFTAANSERLLDLGARQYINHPRGVEIKGDELLASSIYDWFIADFGGDDRGVIAHLVQYAEPALAAALKKFREIDDHRYDWSLNSPAP